MPEGHIVWTTCASSAASGLISTNLGVEFALPLLVRLTAAVAGGELMMCAAVGRREELTP